MPKTEKTIQEYHTKSKSKVPYYQTNDGKFIRGNKKIPAAYLSAENAKTLFDFFNKKVEKMSDKAEIKQLALDVINKGNKEAPYSNSKVGGCILFYYEKGGEGTLYKSKIVDKISDKKIPLKTEKRLSDGGIQNILSASGPGNLESLSDSSADSAAGSGSNLANEFTDSAISVSSPEPYQTKPLVEQATQGVKQASAETMKKYGSGPPQGKKKKRFSLFGNKDKGKNK